MGNGLAFGKPRQDYKAIDDREPNFGRIEKHGKARGELGFESPTTVNREGGRLRGGGVDEIFISV
ncbi:unnamed protein product [Rhodiola kirilowii]